MRLDYKINEFSSLSLDDLKSIFNKKGVLSEGFIFVSEIEKHTTIPNLISNDFKNYIETHLNKKVDVVLSEESMIAFQTACLLNTKMKTRNVGVLDNEDGILQELYNTHNILKKEKVVVVHGLITESESPNIKTLIGIVKKHKANLVGLCAFASDGKQYIEDLKEYTEGTIPIYSIIGSVEKVLGKIS